MKELSIEEKAKRFDEALGKARRYYDEYKTRDNILYIEDMEDMFPELAESVDERIRKELIEMVRLSCTNGDDVDKKIAWLEKQGESDETKAKIFLINKGYPIDSNGKFPTYEEMYYIIKDGLEKQGEQNPTNEPKFKKD